MRHKGEEQKSKKKKVGGAGEGKGGEVMKWMDGLGPVGIYESRLQSLDHGIGI